MGDEIAPHQAEVLVEWWPSASIGEFDAVRHLLESWCAGLMEHLQGMALVDPTVELDLSGCRSWDPVPPEGCTCASFWTLRGRHKPGWCSLAAGLDTTEEPA